MSSRYPELFDDKKRASLSKIISWTTSKRISPKQNSEAADVDHAEGRTGPGPNFQDGEVALIKRVTRAHFKNVFGDDEVNTKFALERYLESQLPTSFEDAARRPLLRMETCVQCHLQVLRSCMSTICENAETKESSALYTYASQFFSSRIKASDSHRHENRDTS